MMKKISEKDILKYQGQGLEIGEMIGGPYDGGVHVIFDGGDVLNHNKCLYRKINKISRHGQGVLCYNYVGHEGKRKK